MIKTVHAQQTGPGSRFTIRTGSGHELAIDDAVGDSAPRPAELLLAALAGCTALDVSGVLAKKRQEVTAYDIEVTGEQRDDPHPHIYRRIDIVHAVTGAAIEVAAVRRAIELSATRYCTATAMLSSGVAEIHHRYVVRGLDGRQIDEGEVVVTGPHADPDALGSQAAATVVAG